MPIYHCPKCNKKYFFEGEASELEKEFECEICGYPYANETYAPSLSDSDSKYTPKCPTCGSPDVERISGAEKFGSALLNGLFSTKIRKSYKCNNCKYLW